MKKIGTTLAVVVVIAGAIYLFSLRNPANTDTSAGFGAPQNDTKTATFDAKNTSFQIDDYVVTLSDGVSETDQDNSSSPITTRYFGNDAKGDINGDSIDDYAFLITQDTGGSGLFYYLVVAISNKDHYDTTDAYLIGDRIAPQNTTIDPQKKTVTVNYAERKPGDPMSSSPSNAISKTFQVSADEKLVPVGI